MSGIGWHLYATDATMLSRTSSSIQQSQMENIAFTAYLNAAVLIDLLQEIQDGIEGDSLAAMPASLYVSTSSTS